MADDVFLSFHYKRDCMRVQQVIRMGQFTDGDLLLSPNAWEKVRRTEGIRPWIDRQIAKKSCVIVLTGTETANREYVQYEIERSWCTEKALFGVRINQLCPPQGRQDPNGPNPFASFTVAGQRLDNLVPLYEPSPFLDCSGTYRWIETNLPAWISAAEAQARTRR